MPKDRCVIGYASAQETEDGVPLVMIGVPEGAWDHIKDGKTNHFDLTPVGLPVKFIIYGGKTPEDCAAIIVKWNDAAGHETVDTRDRDLGIKFPKDQ